MTNETAYGFCTACNAYLDIACAPEVVRYFGAVTITCTSCKPIFDAMSLEKFRAWQTSKKVADKLIEAPHNYVRDECIFMYCPSRHMCWSTGRCHALIQT